MVFPLLCSATRFFNMKVRAAKKKKKEDKDIEKVLPENIEK